MMSGIGGGLGVPHELESSLRATVGIVFGARSVNQRQ
jgi:hypothetical protein